MLNESTPKTLPGACGSWHWHWLETPYPFSMHNLQIFARPNNLQAGHGWIGLGNQLNGTRLIEPDLRERYTQVYGTIKEPDLSKPVP